MKKKKTNFEIVIGEEKYVFESQEGKALVKELKSQVKKISSSEVYQLIKVLSKGKKKKSPEVYGDIQELWDMHDYIKEMEGEVIADFCKYEAIIDSMNALIEGRLYGVAVAVYKWAENNGYNLKDKYNVKELEIEEKAEFCKNYTKADAWFGPSDSGDPIKKEMDYIYNYRYGHKKGE
jgi:hypothetical protein